MTVTSTKPRARTLLASVAACAVLVAAPAAHADEPGITLADEPGISLATAPAPHDSGPIFRLELGFGFASLLDDPDVKQGYGGGVSLFVGMNLRVGFELSVFVSNNNYAGDLGEIGSTFLSGNISAGSFVQLTRPGDKFFFTLDGAVGAYIIAPAVQETIWTLGVAFGATLGYRLSSWFAIGVKVRYHLFNLTSLSGPELRDIKAFQKVGVIDRMEIPAYVAFLF